jgi:hypothetical protein
LKKWKRKQRKTVLVEQKILANASHANVHADVAKEKLAHAKENAHANVIAKNKKKANNQYPERYKLLTFR